MNINLSAPINKLGYGVASLNIAATLNKLGHHVALWPIGQIDIEAKYHDLVRYLIRNQAFFDDQASSLRIYHQFDLGQHVGRGLKAAMCFWELDRFTPRELHHLAKQDVIFVPSRWACEVLRKNGLGQRVCCVPLAVDTDIFSSQISGEVSCDGVTRFLNIGKWETRKGHDILVDAFSAAFDANDKVELWMACENPVVPNGKGEACNASWREMYLKSPMGRVGKIRFFGRQESQEVIASIMRSCDVGVFPSRAEGWGFESAEMMAMGKDVILTSYSGHTEYATKENSLLIDIDRLEDAHDGIYFHATNPEWNGRPGRWAELAGKQFDQLVEHMRSLHKKKLENGSLLLNEASIATFREPKHSGSMNPPSFTWERTAELIVGALNDI